METIWDWLLALGLAAGVGALIGAERESRGHSAGIRTQSLVALAAALLSAAGKSGFIGPNTDLSRIASTVMAGIGFIGGGVILKHRGTVTGLTTAATLFLSAGLGVAIGARLFVPALATTAIALVVIYGLEFLKPFILRRVSRTIQIEYTPGYGTFGPIIRLVQDAGGTIQDLDVEDEVVAGGDPLRRVTIQVLTRMNSDLDDELTSLHTRPEVRHLAVIDH
ncbi:MAG TPA: MgtC/SapB family protein [Acidimicrobiia bacterium]|nr:MgtC/SapB family protein [Acidimicrobiia bacterium]